MRRRRFLQLCATAFATCSSPSALCAASKGNSYATALLTGVSKHSSSDHLRAVISAFLKNGVPLACCVDMSASADGVVPPDGLIADFLGSTAINAPGFFELVPHVPGLGAQSVFFQSRSAFQAREAALAAFGDKVGGFSMQTIACDSVAEIAQPTGVRSAGFRNVVVLPRVTRQVGSEIWPNGTLRIYGGRHLPDDDALRVGAPVAAENPFDVNYINLRHLEVFPLDRAEQISERIARRLGGSPIARRGGNLLPSEIQIRDYFGFRRAVGLLVLDPGERDTGLASAFRELTAELEAARLPFSIHPVPQGEPNPAEIAMWVALEEPGRSTSAGADAGALHSQSTTGAAPHSLLPHVHLRLAGGSTALRGIDGKGQLHVPLVAIRDARTIGQGVAARLGHMEDTALVIDPHAVARAPLRRTLVRELSFIAQDGVTDFVAADALARRIMPEGPLIRRHQIAKAAEIVAPPDPSIAARKGQDALLEDARIAWSYIDRFTDRRTGLCAATRDFSGSGGRSHQAVTMWDVGSQVNALVAAKQLELIDEAEFRSRALKMAPYIAGRETQGRKLPQGWVNTEKTRSYNRDFDGCDAGRLLAAFTNASRHLGPGNVFEKLVKSWDLDKIIIDGEIFSVLNGALSTTFTSHCAHYAARAFRAWGFEASSPYEVFEGKADIDGEMALLEVASRFGPFGAEPLLLEAMEMEMSPESAFLAETLFAAQLETYEQSGELISVSEGPMNRSPWFTYQGLDLDQTEESWVVSYQDEAQNRSMQETGRENRVISSKAAFLWAAYRPHALSELLVEKVRSTARTRYGFASAIFSETGDATKNYSDLNTNGVILQAIAHILDDDRS